MVAHLGRYDGACKEGHLISIDCRLSSSSRLSMYLIGQPPGTGVLAHGSGHCHSIQCCHCHCHCSSSNGRMSGSLHQSWHENSPNNTPYMRQGHELRLATLDISELRSQCSASVKHHSLDSRSSMQHQLILRGSRKVPSERPLFHYTYVCCSWEPPPHDMHSRDKQLTSLNLVVRTYDLHTKQGEGDREALLTAMAPTGLSPGWWLVNACMYVETLA